MAKVLVADVMTRDPIGVKPDTNLLECARKMVKKRVGSLLLMEKKRLVGIISRKDILWAMIKKSKKDLRDIKAIDISPRKIAAIKPDDSIKQALEKMKKYKFRTLPVIKDKELYGFVTVRDILSFSPGFYPEIDEFAQIREESKKLKRLKKTKAKPGVCENCGRYDFLDKVHGRLLCENCREEI